MQDEAQAFSREELQLVQCSHPAEQPMITMGGDSKKETEDAEEDGGAKQSQVVLLNPHGQTATQHVRRKHKKISTKYGRAPFSFFQVLALGCLLLSLILACVAVETWLSSRRVDEAASANIGHSLEQRIYHETMVREINENPTSTWKARYNRFASTAESTQSIDAVEATRILMKKLHLEKNQLLQDTERHIRSVLRKRITLPSHFDARLRWPLCWSVHQIFNQGGCGSCWSIAATSVMSDRVCIATNGSDQTQISAQDLTSCCSSCGGCQGTHWALSSFSFWKERGIVSGGSFGSASGCRPYSLAAECGSPCSSALYHSGRTPSCEMQCQPLHSRSYQEDLLMSSTAYWLRAAQGSAETTPLIHDTIDKLLREAKKDYVELLKRELFLYGPFMVCFTVHEDFQHYESGMVPFQCPLHYESGMVPFQCPLHYESGMVPFQCPLHYESGVYSSEQTSSPELYGHCAKVIGWGREKGTVFWLAANTWGRSWGENGFFRTVLEEIAEEAVAGTFKST